MQNTSAYLSDPDAVAGKDADHVGRIDLALLKRVLPFDDYDFYLCGPSSFMQETYDGLRRLKIADERIHAESFWTELAATKYGQADVTFY
jgi:ferredoxin-NADP reductase